MNLGVSTEDVDEFSSSDSQLMSNEDLTDIQKKNKTAPTETKDNDCQSPPTKTFLTVKEIKEALINLQLCRAIDGDTACYRVLYQEKEEEASGQLSLDYFLKKVDKTPLASTSSQH